MAGDSRGGAKRLLVLGAGAGQLGLLEAARARGLYVVAVDRNPAAIGFPFADRRALISAEDEPQIDRLAVAERVDGLIAPGIDWPVGIAARVAERLGLPHPISPATAALATSKLRQRERFADAGVPHPRYELCSTLEAAAGVAGRLGYPCVVKAPDRQGQRGLSVARDRAELETAFAEALSAARSSTVLVEELLHGQELTVNAFTVDGEFVPLTVTDRRLADPPAFGVALEHIWPSALAPDQVAAAVDAARDAAAALGIVRGPSYTQVVVGRRGAHVVELAARLGGGHDAELCAAALGVDPNALALASALGEPIADVRPRAAAGGACVRFLVPEPGVLQSVSTEDAEEIEGIAWVRIYRQPGAVLTPLRTGSDRAGAVLAVGATRAQALERAERAAQAVSLITETTALV